MSEKQSESPEEKNKSRVTESRESPKDKKKQKHNIIITNK